MITLKLTKYFCVKILFLARQNPQRWAVWVTSWANYRARAFIVTQLQQVETGPSEQGASLVAQMVKNPPAMRETCVWSLGWEDPLEEGMATHSSILAWRIPWTGEPGGLQYMGLQRVGHDCVTKHSTHQWAGLWQLPLRCSPLCTGYFTSRHTPIYLWTAWTWFLITLALNCLKMSPFPSDHSSLPPSPTSTTPTPFITTTVFFPHNFEKTTSLRKQMGRMWRLRSYLQAEEWQADPKKVPEEQDHLRVLIFVVKSTTHSITFGEGNGNPL